MGMQVVAFDPAFDPACAHLQRHHRCSRSEEHTSELQSPCNLVCRLLLEKKKCTCRTFSPLPRPTPRFPSPEPVPTSRRLLSSSTSAAHVRLRSPPCLSRSPIVRAHYSRP